MIKNPLTQIVTLASLGILFSSCATSLMVPTDSIAEITGLDNRESNFPKLEQSWAQTVFATKAAHSDLAANTPASKRNLKRVFGDDSESTRLAVMKTLSKMDKDPVKRGYRLTLVGKNSWDKSTKKLTNHSDSEIAALSVFHYTRPIILLSENYFERKPSDRTPTLIHELSHHAAGTKDHAYNLGAGYTHGATATTSIDGKQATAVEKASGKADRISLNLQKRIENADTIARFAMLYN
jgi:hypothetical protein